MNNNGEITKGYIKQIKLNIAKDKSASYILIVKDIHYKLFWGKASIRHRWRLHKIILVKFNCEKLSGKKDISSSRRDIL